MTNLARHQPRQKIPRERNKDYLGFIGRLPCLYCGKWPVHVCHVRFAETCPDCSHERVYLGMESCATCQGTLYRYGKRPTGAGEKPSDWWTWPGCPECHLSGPGSQHSMNEHEFHAERGVDILWLCTRLQDVYNASKSRADALQSGLAVLENVR